MKLSKYETWRDVDLIDVTGQLALFEEGSPSGPGYLYAAWRKGWIKIGYSTDPARRMTELRAILLALSDRDKTKRDETRVHMSLREHLMLHEYYHPAPPVLGWVRSLPHQRAWPLPVMHLGA